MAQTELPIQIVALTTPLQIARQLVDPARRDPMVAGLVARVADEGKWSKMQVLYLPLSLVPPAAYVYQCSTCAFFHSDSLSCDLVEGLIEPYAWCGLWVNLASDKPLSWLQEGA